VVVVGRPVHASTLQDGISAYASGDYTKGIVLLELLADSGDPTAQTIVGGSYVGGFGVKKDCTKGLKMLSSAASREYARAQYAMGRLSSTGTCVKRNYDESLKWFKKAARQHLADADFAIGLYYSDDLAEAHDFVEAYRWFSLAVRDGEKYKSGAPKNIEAAKSNVIRLEGILSAADLKYARVQNDPAH
jgi:uncharacterized protein